MTMYHSEADIMRLLQAFENGTLPHKHWTHAAHLTIALWYLRGQAKPEALQHIRKGIQRYNAAVGIQNTSKGGYHETLTLFWVQIVQAFLSKVGAYQDIVPLTNELTHAYADSTLPLQYYSYDRLMSSEARAIWVEPDLKKLS